MDRCTEPRCLGAPQIALEELNGRGAAPFSKSTLQAISHHFTASQARMELILLTCYRPPTDTSTGQPKAAGIPDALGDTDRAAARFSGWIRPATLPCCTRSLGNRMVLGRSPPWSREQTGICMGQPPTAECTTTECCSVYPISHP